MLRDVKSAVSSSVNLFLRDTGLIDPTYEGYQGTASRFIRIQYYAQTSNALLEIGHSVGIRLCTRLKKRRLP